MVFMLTPKNRGSEFTLRSSLTHFLTLAAGKPSAAMASTAASIRDDRGFKPKNP
ncbi:hypothetical protein M569_09357 [Genlisea aurea]|uniref:Uncharacterized protein n=1 Tax=Genlisea aurea TaxID=192259 RepID=S8CL27_9LAMI|nr:hypothetical protein M569_09357 [Genlisea aurea]